MLLAIASPEVERLLDREQPSWLDIVQQGWSAALATLAASTAAADAARAEVHARRAREQIIRRLANHTAEAAVRAVLVRNREAVSLR